MFSHDRRPPHGARPLALRRGGARRHGVSAEGSGGPHRGGDPAHDANLTSPSSQEPQQPVLHTSDAGGKAAIEEFSGTTRDRPVRGQPVGSRSATSTAVAAERGRDRRLRQRPEAICDALNEARDAGVKVVTFDSDTNPDCRDLFINQATAEGIAKMQINLITRPSAHSRRDRHPVGDRQRHQPERLDRADEDRVASPRKRQHRARRHGLRRRRRPDVVHQTARCCRPTPS